VTESKEAAQDGLPAPQRYWAAATIWLVLTLSVLWFDANVALPTIGGDLSAPAAEAVWVVNAYQLAIVVSLLPMAAIGEMIGFRRVFQVRIVVFTFGSLGCTFAHSLPMLAFARAIQGFGAAGIMSQNGALRIPCEDAWKGFRLECAGSLGRRGLAAYRGFGHFGGGVVAVAFRGERSHWDRGVPARARFASP
jgi:MFS family permease